VTALLASVRSRDEALQALAGGADLIDFKEPAEGALGRLPDGVIRASLAVLNGARPTSATAGDLPLSPVPAVAAARGIAATGVDFVKIGMFGSGEERNAALYALAAVAADGVALIAVLFADRGGGADTDLLARCADAGFRGVMLDTADKGAGPLLRHLGVGALGRFVEAARRRGLLTGLAGSLRVEDVAVLAPVGADYLGFRTALTPGDRTGGLDPDRVAAVRAHLDQAALAAASRASDAAGAASAAASARAGVAASTRSAKLR
jgi:uncharacterized protein (UPF0264 family)